MNKQHQWVKHVVVPVDIISDPEDPRGFYTVVDSTKLDQAEIAAVFGCAACSEPLLPDTVSTVCQGADKAIDAVSGN